MSIMSVLLPSGTEFERRTNQKGVMWAKVFRIDWFSEAPGHFSDEMLRDLINHFLIAAPNSCEGILRSHFRAFHLLAKGRFGTPLASCSVIVFYSLRRIR